LICIKLVQECHGVGKEYAEIRTIVVRTPRSPVLKRSQRNKARDMRCVFRSMAIALLATLACAGRFVLAATDQDIANERPPADASQREQYWHIDCSATATAMRAALAQLRSDCLTQTQTQSRLEAQPWQQPLRLCATIHQAPGDASAGNCPDYAGLNHYLQSHGAIACKAGDARIASLQEMLECRAATAPSP